MRHLIQTRSCLLYTSQKLREEIETVKNEIKTAQQNYDLEKAAELQYGKLPQLEKQLEAAEEEVKNRDLSLVHELSLIHIY